MSITNQPLDGPLLPHTPKAPLPTPTRARRLASVFAAGGITVAAATLVHFVDPNQPGHYPACPFYALTGFYCPGCGSMRALHFLTTGDLSAAWSMNPTLVLTVPVALVGWSAWLYRAARGHSATLRIPVWLGWAVGGALIIFGVLRNLPGLEFLAPH